MNQRHFGAITLSLVGALALAGCGDDETTDGGGGGGSTDTGVTADTGTPIDTGTPTPDMGEVDMGEPDMGVTPDLGELDTGVPDNGLIDTGVPPDMGMMVDAPTPGTEGADCDAANPMNPCQTGLDCLSLSPMDTDPVDQVAKCLRQCAVDADCAGSLLTPPASNCELGVCVQGFAGEGEVAALYRETVNDQIRVCNVGLERYGGYQFGLEDGEVSCVRYCATDAECTTPGVETCNIARGSFTSTAIPGVCMEGLGYTGAPCNNRNATQGCNLDFDGNGFTICVDYYGNLDDTEKGICTQVCGDVDNDPLTPVENCVVPPTRAGDPAATCITQFRNGNALFPDDNGNPTFGTCSDNCTAFPNSCGGTGPNICYSFGGTEEPELTRCYDVAPPVLPVWTGVTMNPIAAPTAAEDCTGVENSCPDDTFCIGFDGTVSGCVYGCNATAAPGSTGCEGRTIGASSTLACAPLQTGGTAGFCFAP